MKKEDIYTEPVAGEAESAAGEGATACGREPHDNMADDAAAATDTMADDAAQSETDAAAEWRDKFLRLQAEFDNYRKRTLREKMELVETGGRSYWHRGWRAVW